jgi:hypothetical protein
VSLGSAGAAGARADQGLRPRPTGFYLAARRHDAARALGSVRDRGVAAGSGISQMSCSLKVKPASSARRTGQVGDALQPWSGLGSGHRDADGYPYLAECGVRVIVDSDVEVA